MKHWQVLKLMVAGLWSENAQDEICQKKGGSCVQERRNVTSIRTFLVVLFFLAAGGATKGRTFLLSEVELIRVGSIVAYLAISWARVVDLNLKAEIGPTTL
jgi:hypothetical protein